MDEQQSLQAEGARAHECETREGDQEAALDDEEADEEDEGAGVMLGFPSAQLRSALGSEFFPSKLGGRPAWLHPQQPKQEHLKCGLCNGDLSFMLQLYAPIDGESDAFHRTLFVFCCRNGCELSKGNDWDGVRPGNACVRVFRSQLPRANNFYDFHPKEIPKIEEIGSDEEGDPIGGGREEGRMWSNEMELLVEPEDDQPELQHEKAKSNNPTCDPEFVDANEVPASRELHSPQMQQWTHFQTTLLRAPEQCVRYCKGRADTILWPRIEPRPMYASVSGSRQSDTGFRLQPCSMCGAYREYEFQVLPTILYYLEEDDGHRHATDFGTIVVYTCSSACSPAGHNVSYCEEVAFVQPPMAFDLKHDLDVRRSNATS